MQEIELVKPTRDRELAYLDEKPLYMRETKANPAKLATATPQSAVLKS